MSGCELCCAPKKRYGTEEAIFLLEKAVDIQNFPRCAPNHGAMVGTQRAGRLWRPFFEMSATHLSGSLKHSCGCAFYFLLGE